MQLYKIRELALRSKRAVYTAQQLANLIGKSKPIATVYLSRLVKQNLARKLLRGYITFVEDDQVIASQLVEPTYISLTSALSIHRLITQVPARTECVCTKNSRQYKSLGITYHKIPTALFYGYERRWKGNSYIVLATPEKALLDSIYLNLIDRGTAQELAVKLDKKKLAELVSRFKGRGKKKLERILHL